MSHRSDRIKRELDEVNYRELSDIGIEALCLMPLPQLLQVIDAVRADMGRNHRAKFDAHFMRELAA
jgi:hypothetical protein